jgi:glutaminyl-tRNA synthetase
MVENNPEDPDAGSREVSFSRELYIESDDFMEIPEKKYFRHYPGNEVRLKSAYIVRCKRCEKDPDGNITTVYATYDADSRGGNTTDGRKIKATIHWVDAKTAIPAAVRLYDRLFDVEEPDLADCNYLEHVRPDSLEILSDAKLEASLKNATTSDHFQFLRLGYFCLDSKDSTETLPAFNRSVSLKDSYRPNV